MAPIMSFGIASLRRWAKNLLIQDVPSDIALCEFDCRKDQCRDDEWETCDRRLTRAAGELSPSVEAKAFTPK